MVSPQIYVANMGDLGQHDGLAHGTNDIVEIQGDKYKVKNTIFTGKAGRVKARKGKC